ncbi:hypothetical protein HKX48_006816 [Thoreauomyces humboldtii]|nr:hypothetical protein HKX48_006816 [Thoreauomyces humboldtii]
MDQSTSPPDPTEYHELAQSTDMRSYRPLPAEILEMSEAETACQYCGISYLLLSKYERMVDHVKGLETHLVELQDYAKERPAFLKRIESSETRQRAAENAVNDLRNQLQESQRLARESFLELEESHKQSEKLSEAVSIAMAESKRLQDEKRVQVNRLVRHLADIRSELLEQRREVNTVKASMRKSNSVMIRDTLPAIHRRLQNEMATYMHRQQQAFAQMLQRKTQGELGVMAKNLALKVEELQQAEERNTRLAQEIKMAKVEADEHVNAQKNYAHDVRSTCLKLDDQLHAAKTHSANLTHERDRLASRYHALELRLTEERRLQSTDRSTLETQIAVLSGKLSAKERELQDANAVHAKELRTRTADGDAVAQRDEVIQGLERSIREMHGTTQSMQRERQKTIEAHQSRVRQLQDKFVKDLETAGHDAAARRETELRREFAVDKEEAVRFLRESLTLEMNEATDRLNRQLEALRHAKTQTDQQAAAIATQWERKHQIASGQLTTLQASNAADFAHYQARIRALEEQLVQAATPAAAVAAERSPADSKQEAEMKTVVKKQEAEIRFLKDMVRVECEERMGLVAELALVRRGSTTSMPPAVAAAKTPPIAYHPSSGLKKNASGRSMPQLLPPAPEPAAAAAAGPLEPGEKTFQALMKAAAAKKGKLMAARSSIDMTGRGGAVSARSGSSRSSWSMGVGRIK